MLHLFKKSDRSFKMASKFTNQLLTACKQYYLAAGATQGNIAYTQTVVHHIKKASNSIKSSNFDTIN